MSSIQRKKGSIKDLDYHLTLLASMRIPSNPSIAWPLIESNAMPNTLELLTFYSNFSSIAEDWILSASILRREKYHQAVFSILLRHLPHQEQILSQALQRDADAYDNEQFCARIYYCLQPDKRKQAVTYAKNDANLSKTQQAFLARLTAISHP